MKFDGTTFDQERDGVRLGKQLLAVRHFMLGLPWYKWVTLQEIADAIEAPTASLPAISARLRDLRKLRFGSFDVRSRYVTRGLWEYQIAGPTQTKFSFMEAGGDENDRSTVPRKDDLVFGDQSLSGHPSAIRL